MAVEARSPALLELVPPSAEAERLATGFTFTEGPVWHPDGFLRFSDIPENRRWHWDPAGGARVDRSPSNNGNGMAYDAGRGLLICEHATSRVVREAPDGSVEVIASHYDGRELNSPNDVVVASDGSIVFTDPTYGRTERFGIERGQELPLQGVYRVPAAGGGPVLLIDDFTQPNGLCLSPDESRLYVNDSQHCLIRVFDVLPDGRLANGRLFAENVTTGDRADGVTDGMKCDALGNVWVTGPFGLWVFSPAGEHLGIVRIPERTANFCWGGPDWTDLYTTSTTSLFRLRTLAAGAPPAFVRG
jgi:gluconolactonase